MAAKGKSSFINNFFVLGVGTFLYMIVGVIGTPIITRLVDPVDYGSMSMLTVYSNIGMMLCGLGLDQTLVRYFYHKEELSYQNKLLRTCFSLSFIAFLVLGSLLAVFSVLSSKFGFKGLPVVELALLEVNVFASLTHRFSQLVLRLRYHTKAYSAVNIVQKVSYIVFTVLLVLLIKDHHFVILAVSTILSTLLGALIAILIERDVWKPLPGRGYVLPVSRQELLKYGLPIMLSSGISLLFNALDKLFINHYCTLADVGVYASAMNLMAVFSIVRTSFNALWMPTAVEHYERNPEDKKFYQQGNAFISMLMISFGAAVILFKDFFVLLLGSEYHEASKIIPFLMFEPIMYTISETTATGIVVQKKSVYQVAVAGGACLVNFLGNWWLTPIMGPQGAALSTGVSYIVFFVIRTVLANKVFYVDYKLPKFAVAVLALVLFAVYGSNHSFSLIQVAMFIGVIGITLLVYKNYIGFALDYGKQIIKKVLKRG